MVESEIRCLQKKTVLSQQSKVREQTGLTDHSLGIYTVRSGCLHRVVEPLKFNAEHPIVPAEAESRLGCEARGIWDTLYVVRSLILAPAVYESISVWQRGDRNKDLQRGFATRVPHMKEKDSKEGRPYITRCVRQILLMKHSRRPRDQC